jgi:TM2 domain-containing membrane protein YozV
MNCANHPDVEKVAFCRTCGKPLCANCTRSVHGVIYCESCLAARLEGVQPNVAAPAAGFVAASPSGVPVPLGGPNPALAGVLAGFFPFGVGAVYTGQYAKGLAHLVIFTLLVVGASSGSEAMATVCGLGIAGFYFYQIIDSVRSARALQLGLQPPDPFGLGTTFSGGERLDATKVPVGALVLIGLGVLFLLHTLDIWDFSARRIWPLVLIGIGGVLLFRRLGLIGEVPPGFDRVRSCKHGLMGPAILLTLGFQFLLDSMGVIRFGRPLPLLLVVIGLVKIFQSTAGPGPLDGPATPYSAGTPPSGFAPGEVPPPSYPQNQPEVKPEVKNG